MRILALLVVVSGCSFATATLANRDPERGCSYAPAIGDFTIAGISAISMTAALVAKRYDDHCEDAMGHCTLSPGYDIAVGLGILVGLVQLLQGAYGLGKASACEAARTQLARQHATRSRE